MRQDPPSFHAVAPHPLLIAAHSVELHLGPERARSPTTAPAHGSGVEELASPEGAWRVCVQLAAESDRPAWAAAVASGSICCVIGDVNEVRLAPDSAPYVNATLVTLDVRNASVRIVTSLTGLPPLFALTDRSGTVFSCPFLPSSSDSAPAPDLDGIADTLRWGHPIDGRTLYASIRLVQASSLVEHPGRSGTSVASIPWPSTPELDKLTRTQLVAEQVTALAQAARRMPADSAFMSLSGGLDSRTALVAMLANERRAPCVTMAGSPENLDARLARAFCSRYGIEHHLLLFDESFYRCAAELLLKSAELTGGVAAMSQTADMHLYRSVPIPYEARVSGNLGNQAGRGGVESLSAYQPDERPFDPDLRRRLAQRPTHPWFIPRLGHGNYGPALFGQEVAYWSVANYVTGSAWARQLTPYADRRLLQLSCALYRQDPQLRAPDWRALRKRDMRHRLFGTPFAYSFQRQFLVMHDQRAADVPLNWGWLARGGRSMAWTLAATASAADAAMIKLSGSRSSARTLGRVVSGLLHHRSALVDWRRALRTNLRELAMDTFSSRRVRELGVFDVNGLDAMVADHFQQRADAYYTVARALEIALGLTVRRPPHRNGRSA